MSIKRPLAAALVLLFLVGLPRIATAKGHSGEGADTAPILRVLAAFPAEGASVVRPDAVLRVSLRTEARGWEGIRKKLEDGKFGLRLEGDGNVAWFLPEKARKEYLQDKGRGDGKGRGIPFTVSEAIAFDPARGVVSAGPGMLVRYTTYEATLAVEDALETLLKRDLGTKKGHDAGHEDKAYSWTFTTGSAIGEPTHLDVSSPNPLPRVTEGGLVRVSVTDDYGGPAIMGSVRAESRSPGGAAPLPSVALDPASVVLSPADPGGDLTIAVSDRQAEGALVTVSTEGPWPEDSHSAALAFRFLPGPPANIVLSVPGLVTVGTSVPVSGTVTDVYGNPVEDGTPVEIAVSDGKLSAPVAQTRGGRFAVEFTAPERLSKVSGQGQKVVVTVRAGSASASADITLVAPVTHQVRTAGPWTVRTALYDYSPKAYKLELASPGTVELRIALTPAYADTYFKTAIFRLDGQMRLWSANWEAAPSNCFLGAALGRTKSCWSDPSWLFPQAFLEGPGTLTASLPAGKYVVLVSVADWRAPSYTLEATLLPADASMVQVTMGGAQAFVIYDGSISTPPVWYATEWGRWLN